MRISSSESDKRSEAVSIAAISVSEGSRACSAVSNRSHFDSKMPGTAMLCRGCKVALSCRNIHPLWGLHNGACGTVDEITFGKDCNPNNGDDPLYVVVDFPNYKGPVWDKDNPTVRHCEPTSHCPLCLTCIILFSSMFQLE